MPIRKKLLALLLAAVLVCTMSLTAFAREAPDTSRKGSIQLTIRQGGTAVPGGSFTLYQVGALQEEDGNYRFVLTEAFAGSKVSLEEVSSAQLANTLAAYAKDHKLSGTARTWTRMEKLPLPGWSWACICWCNTRRPRVMKRQPPSW